MAAGAAPVGADWSAQSASRTSSPPRGIKGASRPGPQKSAPAKAGENQFAGDVPSPLSVFSALRALAPRTRPPWGCAPDRLSDPAPAKRLTRKNCPWPRECLCSSSKAAWRHDRGIFRAGGLGRPHASRRGSYATRAPKMTIGGGDARSSIGARPPRAPLDSNLGAITLTAGHQNKPCRIRIIVLLCSLRY